MNGKVTTFGTTGYTYNNIFVLYDRLTSSIWYPLENGEMNAISGPRTGDYIPIEDEPSIMTLGEWITLHPDTSVLFGDGAADKSSALSID